MKHNTGIEWTHWEGFKGETWNPLGAVNNETGERGWFCIHASPGCSNCYAEQINQTKPFGMGTGHSYQHQNLKHITFQGFKLDQPLRWTKPRCIFVNSMTDLHLPEVPVWLRLWPYIVASVCPQHRFLFLTKRPHQMLQDIDLLKRSGIEWNAESFRVTGYADNEVFQRWRKAFEENGVSTSNIYLGTSVEDQKRANERVIPLYRLYMQGFKTFVSFEPALEVVNWTRWGFLHWFISGGESGTNARAVHPDAFRVARDFCKVLKIPFFHKQNGHWIAEDQVYEDVHRESMVFRYFGAKAIEKRIEKIGGWDGLFDEGKLAQFPDSLLAAPVGKKYAGRHLDGKLHNGFPE